MGEEYKRLEVIVHIVSSDVAREKNEGLQADCGEFGRMLLYYYAGPLI